MASIVPVISNPAPDGIDGMFNHLRRFSDAQDVTGQDGAEDRMGGDGEIGVGAYIAAFYTAFEQGDYVVSAGSHYPLAEQLD